MKKWTSDELIANDYTFKNAKIKSASLNMKNHSCLTFDIVLEGAGWGVVFGGYSFGHGHLGSDTFTGSGKGLEAIMRIMDTVGVDDVNDLPGKYVRIAVKKFTDPVKIIGNIIDDKWFDYGTFFE